MGKEDIVPKAKKSKSGHCVSALYASILLAELRRRQTAKENIETHKATLTALKGKAGKTAKLEREREKRAIEAWEHLLAEMDRERTYDQTVAKIQEIAAKLGVKLPKLPWQVKPY